jgi:signal transduction histidine kinase
LHGHDLLQRGFTVRQVVHDYGDVCQSITEIAMETGAPIHPDEFGTLNGCLDEAIADAVTAYGAESHGTALAHENARESAHLGFFIHELRNLVQTATFASEALLTGNVAPKGSTAGVLRRSLNGLRSLIDNAIADVRHNGGIQHPEVFSVSKFIEEVGATAAFDATSHNVTLTVVSGEKDTEVLGDRRNLAAAINNLLQNAMKFTRAGSAVTLRTVGAADRVLIEVQDECGGFPEGKNEELFHPFEQRGSDRSGLGLGLAYSQWVIVSNGGRLYVRNLPPFGCVFIADLPRHRRSSETVSDSLMRERRSERRQDRLAYDGKTGTANGGHRA